MAHCAHTSALATSKEHRRQHNGHDPQPAARVRQATNPIKRKLQAAIRQPAGNDDAAAAWARTWQNYMENLTIFVRAEAQTKTDPPRRVRRNATR
jgi:thioesterase domain-containing protein